MKRKLGKSLCSMLLALAMVIGLMPGMSLTAKAAPAETLLTTITPKSKTTYNETTSGIVTVSHNNDTYYAYAGWVWDYVADTLTVSGCEGYTITKVIFKQGASSFTDSSAPFELHFDGSSMIFCRENFQMYGVTSIQVYGYANTVDVTVTYSVVNGTWSDGTTANITETVASGSVPTSVPSGMIANSGYTGGSWDTDPASATITGNITFTYTFEAESVAPAPVDPTKPDTPTPEPVTPAPESEVPADTTPSGSSSPAPVITPEQARTMTVSNFVERLYLTALNRSYDVTGRDNWVDQIINKDASGSAIARGFFNSQEFIARELDNEEFVNTLYRVFFDREPDTQGFTNWINALENGATRSEVINEFAGSTEWTSMCARFGINA